MVPHRGRSQAHQRALRWALRRAKAAVALPATGGRGEEHIGGGIRGERVWAMAFGEGTSSELCREFHVINVSTATPRVSMIQYNHGFPGRQSVASLG